MKKVLVCVALVFALGTMAFAADGGHGSTVIVPDLETAPSTVLDAVAGTAFVPGASVAVSSGVLTALQNRYGTSVVVLNVPSMTAGKAGVFVFGITVPSGMVGKALSLFHFYLKRGEVAASAETIPSEGHKYLDANGKEISVVPADGKVFVAVNVPAAGTYEPLIAVEEKSGKSGGGCDAGFSLAGLLSLGALFLLRKGK